MIKKIKFYKGLLIEICETLCSICLYLDFEGRNRSRNPHAEYMRSHFNVLKRYSAEMRGEERGY